MRETLAKCDWKHFQTNSYLQCDADGCRVSETYSQQLKNAAYQQRVCIISACACI